MKSYSSKQRDVHGPIGFVWFGHLAESLQILDSGLHPTLTADQLTHAESRGGGGGGGGRGGRLVERALPVGHVQQAGLGGCWPRLTLLLDTRTRRVTHELSANR